MGNTDTRDLDRVFSAWQRRIFATLWVTYGSFYLCRVNMAIALPGIMEELGYSKTDVGGIGSAFFMAYAIGQFVNGQLGDRVGARRLIPVGIVASAVLNILFGFSTTLGIMMVLWGLNGYFQAMGWSPSVKTLANWFPPERRGKVAGLYGSSYQMGNVASWLLGGYLALHYGWRYVFWVPAGLFLLSAIHCWVRVRNAPEDIGLPSIEEYRRGGVGGTVRREVEGDRYLGLGYTLRRTVGSSHVWRAGFAYLFISVVAYGFLYWTPTYLSEVYGLRISQAGSRGIVLPLAGSVGALCAGWATDRLFGSRRAPVIVIMLLLATGFLIGYPRVPLSSPVIGLVGLGAVGFMMYGAQTVLVASVAMDFGTRKAAASTTGFIDGMGYVGATLFTGIGSGWLVEHHGWNVLFYAWAGCVLLGAGVMATLWGYRPGKGAYH